MKGDQLVKVEVIVPKKLSDRQKEILKEFEASINPGNLGTLTEEKGKGLFGKKKK